MAYLEPTYLRYVYDGLNKGSLNPENAAALPQGFIGLYEQEFIQKTPSFFTTYSFTKPKWLAYLKSSAKKKS